MYTIHVPVCMYIRNDKTNFKLFHISKCQFSERLRLGEARQK